MATVIFHKPSGILEVDTDNRPPGLTVEENAECDRCAAKETDDARITALHGLGIGTLTTAEKDELIGLLAKKMNNLY